MIHFQKSDFYLRKLDSRIDINNKEINKDKLEQAINIILMGCNLPMIYLVENREGRWTTLFNDNVINDLLKYIKLAEYIENYSARDQNKIEEALVTVCVIKYHHKNTIEEIKNNLKGILC